MLSHVNARLRSVHRRGPFRRVRVETSYESSTTKDFCEPGHQIWALTGDLEQDEGSMYPRFDVAWSLLTSAGSATEGVDDVECLVDHATIFSHSEFVPFL